MKSSYKILQESLNIDTLIVNLRSRFDSFTDKHGKNSSVSLTDILMSAYAIFSLKYSSLLQFEIQNPLEKENLMNLFCLTKTCNDSQMRVVLDQVNPDDIRQLYPQNFQALEDLGIIKEYEFWKKYLIIAIDGVHHFESKKIHCEGCLKSNRKMVVFPIIIRCYVLCWYIPKKRKSLLWGQNPLSVKMV